MVKRFQGDLRQIPKDSKYGGLVLRQVTTHHMGVLQSLSADHWDCAIKLCDAATPTKRGLPQLRRAFGSQDVSHLLVAKAAKVTAW